MPRAAWADASASTEADGATASRCWPAASDVTDASACQAAIEEGATRLGGIDALVYATGIGPLAPGVHRSDGGVIAAKQNSTM